MRGPRKAKVTQERTVHTHAELWQASECVLRVGQRQAKGWRWQFLSSIVLTAFAFEAYLNHVGPKVISEWKCLQKLSPMEKLCLVSSTLNVSYPRGKGARPISTITELFKFRNQIAHGKPSTVTPHP